MKNPRGYHGNYAEVEAFVAKAGRNLKNYEAIGTWVTTNKDHARQFGSYIYQVDFPDALKFYKQHDKDDLGYPFIFPGTSNECRVLTKEDKALLMKAYIESPKFHKLYGNRCYEKIDKLYEAGLRKVDDDPFSRMKYRERCKPPADLTKVLRQAQDLRFHKMLRNPKYIEYLWDYYTSQGYDGIAWENTHIDVGALDDNDYRHSQYLIFHPENYPFSPVASL